MSTKHKSKRKQKFRIKKNKLELSAMEEVKGVIEEVSAFAESGHDASADFSAPISIINTAVKESYLNTVSQCKALW